jgi:hypothetical protein
MTLQVVVLVCDASSMLLSMPIHQIVTNIV